MSDECGHEIPEAGSVQYGADSVSRFEADGDGNIVENHTECCCPDWPTEPMIPAPYYEPARDYLLCEVCGCKTKHERHMALMPALTKYPYVRRVWCARCVNLPPDELQAALADKRKRDEVAAERARREEQARAFARLIVEPQRDNIERDHQSLGNEEFLRRICDGADFGMRHYLPLGAVEGLPEDRCLICEVRIFAAGAEYFVAGGQA